MPRALGRRRSRNVAKSRRLVVAVSFAVKDWAKTMSSLFLKVSLRFQDEAGNDPVDSFTESMCHF